MVDFGKLRAKSNSEKSVDPIDIFRHLPKPTGIADLYSSQAEVLSSWFSSRNNKDVVIKLHTGGGKTLVGLLIALSSQNETKEPALYLAPTIQLVNQTIEKAKALSINAVPYVARERLNDQFINGKAILVATYKALFNGKSKFGLRGSGVPQKVSCIILDDAHTAFSVVRDSFTLSFEKEKDVEGYKSLCSLFRQSFKEMDKIGTFDDVVSGGDYSILEVPYWSWVDKIDAVSEIIRRSSGFDLVWPLLRDKLKYCHVLISKKSFTITPIHPFVNVFPTFFDSPRRIYMSATIADDSEIINTFNANLNSVLDPLQSKSLAGISERMILIPELMKMKISNQDIKRLIDKTVSEKKGVIALAPSDDKAENLSQLAVVVKGSEDVESSIRELQSGLKYGPYVYSNRYDGIDLPGDSCRLLILYSLPMGTSNYELFRASSLWGSSSITRVQAQRIEQGIGRGARGSGDFCVVMLKGSDLTSWVAKESNFLLLTSPTKAQIEIGMQVSKEITDIDELEEIVLRCYNRDAEWISYHADALADLIADEKKDESRYYQTLAERKALNYWIDGYFSKAISTLENFLSEYRDKIGSLNTGWIEQYIARIAYDWGQVDKADELQKEAYSNNRNLFKPKIVPPYRPLPLPMEQAIAISQNLGNYHIMKGFLQHFENTVINLYPGASANQFESSLCELGKIIGFEAERHDECGLGPDVLWLLPDKIGFVIEAKSRKKEKNALTKEEHGQLLVAQEWFKSNYPDYTCTRVSVHPKNQATEAAVAGASHALTYESLNILISDVRSFLHNICELHLTDYALKIEIEKLLEKTPFYYKNFSARYLKPFETVL